MERVNADKVTPMKHWFFSVIGFIVTKFTVFKEAFSYQSKYTS